jgi:NADPH:quinone reductase-like Zn-dependent oxidoreductase
MSLKQNLIKFRAARLISFGSPLRVEAVMLPTLGPYDVSVEVHFTGINFYELMIMNGKYPSLPILPAIIGGELAGKVLEIGPEVKLFKKGDRVFSLAQTGKGTTGSYAERVHVNEKYLYHLPREMSFETGATIPMITFAAYTMLSQRVNIPKKGVILVYSAAGGVGSSLIQFIKALYPKTIIIGTCSNEQKMKVVRSLGADVVINTKKGPLVDQLHAKFGTGIDIIFDPIGQQYFDVNLSLLRPLSGTICSYGTYTGSITDSGLVSKLRKDNLTLSGFLMWPLLENKKLCLGIFTKIFKLIKTKQFKPLIDRVFPLKNINEAIERIRQRKNIGKVLIKTHFE